MRFLYFILPIITSIGCSQNATRFESEHLDRLPSPPDYSNIGNWAAHPQKADQADKTPHGLVENQANAEVDVFFIHPTIYTEKQKKEYPWNADLHDEKLNKEVDESTILNQASVFNSSARIYAPRYRQAHIKVFRINNPSLKKQALEIAYEDVKEAFSYYLKNERNGRPFIIAGHSQGTIHGGRLIQDFVDKDDELRADFIAGYLIGIALKPDLFTTIEPCENPDDIGCWVGWNTFAYGYYPETYETVYKGTLTTNPLSWDNSKPTVDRCDNPGSVLWNFEKIQPAVCDATVTDGLLWIHKPVFPGSFLFNWKSYHVADYNLFYASIRNNVALRVERFLSEKQAKD